MQKNTLLLLIALIICGCSFPGVYKITITQGNVVDPEMVEQLRPGMTRDQVYFVMGQPLVENTFNRDTDSYVYTVQVDGGETRDQIINVHYVDGLYSHYSGELKERSSLRPATIREEQESGRKYRDDA